LDPEQQLPIEAAVRIAPNVAEALDNAHGQGVTSSPPTSRCKVASRSWSTSGSRPGSAGPAREGSPRPAYRSAPRTTRVPSRPWRDALGTGDRSLHARLCAVRDARGGSGSPSSRIEPGSDPVRRPRLSAPPGNGDPRGDPPATSKRTSG
jgi:hypothetical protein